MGTATTDNRVRHLVLVRHGQSEINQYNASQVEDQRKFCGQFETPLTPVGREQATAAGHQIAARPDLRIRNAVSSSLQRARDTLELIVSELPQPVSTLTARPELNERSLGEFEGHQYRDIYNRYPQYSQAEIKRFGRDFIHKAPGGENLTEVSNRAWQCIVELWMSTNDDLLVVSHDITLRCILGQALHLPHERTGKLDIPHAHPIVLRQNNQGGFDSLEQIATK